jgi:hypothetical protein
MRLRLRKDRAFPTRLHFKPFAVGLPIFIDRGFADGDDAILTTFALIDPQEAPFRF